MATASMATQARSPRWRLFATPASLARRGVLGINRRNAEIMLRCNPRAFYPRVDDKLVTKQLCEEHGIPVPETFAVLDTYGSVKGLGDTVAGRPEFVVKPARGAAGRGIVVVRSHSADRFQLAGQQDMTIADLRYHVGTILAGLFSLGGRPDRAIVEQRIVCHPSLREVSVAGTPDIRVIIFRRVPVMAMVRLPTSASRGRANLHQGAVGAGIDIATGRTTGGVLGNRMASQHPDTGVSIDGFQLPAWDEILDISMRLCDVLELGYVGVDVVIDIARGPVVLEANARPGLAIQLANRRGLLPRLRLVADRARDTLTCAERLQTIAEVSLLV